MCTRGDNPAPLFSSRCRLKNSLSRQIVIKQFQDTSHTESALKNLTLFLALICVIISLARSTIIIIIIIILMAGDLPLTRTDARRFCNLTEHGTKSLAVGKLPVAFATPFAVKKLNACRRLRSLSDVTVTDPKDKQCCRFYFGNGNRKGKIV
ncbi:hypothetical protein EVAR_70277_1 [Eumeta japonica]|uniref:Uncharacterized protein n=1 Tax=Eumeta variegata TaxID=151549 RepID=A0A4C2A0U4_EUMVA|nr:hypothetical protein EVAR_70277_1 [Eumeta japonica]